jgi:hypothetical protein
VRERLRIGLAIAAIGAGLVLAGVTLNAGDRRYGLPSPADRVLFLRSGNVAHRLMLSFDSLAADVYWMRTIQHYGSDRLSRRQDGRFELLYPLLDLTTTLDPYFTVAYRFGAVFLASPAPDGLGRPDQAIALLQKGLARSPRQWKYALDIGFIYYWYGAASSATQPDYAAAAGWFERAAGMPGAPAWLGPLAAITRAQGGDRAGARQLLQNLVGSEEAWIRRAAERGLQQLRALDEIDALQKLSNDYLAQHQTRPSRWADFVPGVKTDDAPLDPAGVPYEFDQTANRVTLSQRSSLWPLPATLSHR